MNYLTSPNMCIQKLSYYITKPPKTIFSYFILNRSYSKLSLIYLPQTSQYTFIFISALLPNSPTFCFLSSWIRLTKFPGLCRIGVDEWLRIPSVEDVFALGDCAGFLEQTGKSVLPALAQV